MGRIPEETIQNIVQSTDIVELISSYFPLKRRGTNFLALCPFHNEKTPSFNVQPSTQRFHCFGCGASGSAIGFLMDYENLTFIESVKKLAEQAGIPLVEAEYDPKEEQRARSRNRALKLLAETAEFYHQQLMSSPAADHARKYLRGRGIGKGTARNWLLGHAPNADKTYIEWAKSKQYTARNLMDAGLASLRDEHQPQNGIYLRFRDRLMFPIRNDYGDVIGFSGRILDPYSKLAKYTNSPETLLFKKSKIFFGLDKSKRAIAKKESAIVCEGQLDLITCFESGIENVIAPLGTAFTSEHSRILKRYAKEVVLCFDSDGAGYKAAIRSFSELARVSMVVRVMSLPDGEDPDSLIKKEGVAEFQKRLEAAKDFFDFQIERRSAELDMTSIGDRMRFSAEIAATVAQISDKIMQDSVIHNVATRLKIPAKDFRMEVAKVSKRKTFESQFVEDSPPEKADASLVSENRTIASLCHLALTDSDARAWLSENVKKSALQDVRGAEVLLTALQAGLDISSPHAMNLFLASLDKPQEAYLSKLLAQKMPVKDGVSAASDCLQALRKQALENRLHAAISSLNEPGLTADQLIARQKEVLDVKNELNDIARSPET